MAKQNECQPHGHAAEEPCELHAPDPQKVAWPIPDRLPLTPAQCKGVESDSSTELGSEGSDDESHGEDITPVSACAGFTFAETLVIFDWDDTLLPTSWLRQHGLTLHGAPIRCEVQLAHLELLAASASQVLCQAKDLGRLVIVTNAETGWVELSCQRFLPSLLPALEGVQVVSARSVFESPAVRSPVEWKRLAFTREVRAYYGVPPNDRFWNIVTLGDSLHEQQALLSATYGVVTCHAKFVKFAERPDVQQLVTQHEEVGLLFRRIVDYDGDLDIHALALDLPPASGEEAAVLDA